VAGTKLEYGSDLFLLGGLHSKRKYLGFINNQPRSNAFLPNNALEMKLPWQAKLGLASADLGPNAKNGGPYNNALNVRNDT
jgi:hypothetical protein